MKLIELQPYISANYIQLVFTDGYCEYFSWHKKNDDECEYISIEEDDYTTNLFKNYPNLTVGEIDVDTDELIIRVLEEA